MNNTFAVVLTLVLFNIVQAVLLVHMRRQRDRARVQQKAEHRWNEILWQYAGKAVKEKQVTAEAVKLIEDALEAMCRKLQAEVERKLKDENK